MACSIGRQTIRYRCALMREGQFQIVAEQPSPRPLLRVRSRHRLRAAARSAATTGCDGHCQSRTMGPESRPFMGRTKPRRQLPVCLESRRTIESADSGPVAPLNLARPTGSAHPLGPKLPVQPCQRLTSRQKSSAPGGSNAPTTRHLGISAFSLYSCGPLSLF